MISEFITGIISDRCWWCLVNAASYGQNGMWACLLEHNILGNGPALLGVILPSYKRVQIIRGNYGVTIYGEDELAVIAAKTALFNMLNFTNETCCEVPA